MKIGVLVATHKQYRMPTDAMYIPIHVGSAINSCDLGIIGDDTGENISRKNKNYCELTAMYWAWKNLNAEYIGLVHYRRHFAERRIGDKWSRLLTGEKANKLLQDVNVILPRKRRYYIETNYKHYIHGHKQEGIDAAIAIIEQDYPEYVLPCQMVMNRKWAHMFNMMIMKRDIYCSYCSWLFAILNKLEMRLDTSSYSPFEARLYGRISEMFLDVWIEKNEIKYKEVSFAFMERSNWLEKGGAFVLRKMCLIKENNRY